MPTLKLIHIWAVVFIVLCASGKGYGQVTDRFSGYKNFRDLVNDFEGRISDNVYCKEAIPYFKEYYRLYPDSALYLLYLGRAYDKVAAIDNHCDLDRNEFQLYSDSALLYYQRARQIDPYVRDLTFHFTPNDLIGHLYGTRACVAMINKEYERIPEIYQAGGKDNGFSSQLITNAYAMLMSCDSNAILFTMGDDDTFPLLYLQHTKAVRNDITVVNISLLNMEEYLLALSSTDQSVINPLPFNQLSHSLVNLTTIFRGDNSVKTYVHPSAKSRYLSYVGEPLEDSITMRIPFSMSMKEEGSARQPIQYMSSIFILNQWKRPIYYTYGMGADCGDDEYDLHNEGFVYQVIPVSRKSVFKDKVGDGRWIDFDRYEKVFTEYFDPQGFTSDSICSIDGFIVPYGLVLSYAEHESSLKKETVKKVFERLPLPPTGYVKQVISSEYLPNLIYFLEKRNNYSPSRQVVDCSRLFAKEIKHRAYEEEYTDKPFYILLYMTLLDINSDCKELRHFFSYLENVGYSTESIDSVREKLNCYKSNKKKR